MNKLFEMAQRLEAKNAKQPDELREIPKAIWPEALLRHKRSPFKAMRSKTFLVQLFQQEQYVRMSICRTELDGGGGWRDAISWEELQTLKREAGYGKSQAVELFPADEDVVNIANMRHLWILPDGEHLSFTWRRGNNAARD